jgi:GntR family transcriptional regulator / MocR family aminotransferase
LAAELGMSRGLVIEAFQQLEAEGYITTHPGSGTRVATGLDVAELAATTVRARAPRACPIDFLPGQPDLVSFPVVDWRWGLAEAMRTASSSLADYNDPAGVARLRTVLAAYLRRVRGAMVDPNDLVISAGFTQGVGLVLSELAGRGLKTVAVEEPGHPDCARIAAASGLRAVPVPVDERGLVVDRLKATNARAVILTPAHQTPTGVVLAPERRLELIEWAETSDSFLVEDDYDAEFRYDRQPVGAMQGLAPHRVFNVGTVSKSLAPALRLGWVACPSHFTDAVAERKQLADRGSPALDQLALAVLIESGRFDKHLRHMRRLYASRRNTLVDALAQHVPRLHLSGLAAGFHAIAPLRGDVDEDELIAQAATRGVGVHGVTRYYLERASHRPALVIGFGNVTERAIESGVAAIADLLRQSAGAPDH